MSASRRQDNAHHSGHVSVQESIKSRVLDTPLFETFVSRLVRQHLISQFVDKDHIVLQEETKLVLESENRLRSHLDQTSIMWNIPWRLSKMVVKAYLKSIVSESLRDQDVEEEVKTEAFTRIMEDDFESLWPRVWQEKSSGVYPKQG